jgi:hypothetical protein
VAATSWALPSWGDDRAVATELFNAGRDLMNAGDFAAACPKLAESVRLDPTVGALAKLAACEEHEQKVVQSRGHWEQALNLARSLHDPREAEVAGELARIDHVVPKLVLSAAAPLPADVALRIDDLSLGLGTLGVSLPVAPGPHRVSAKAPGFEPWSASFDAVADGSTTTLVVPRLAPLPTAAAPTAEPPRLSPAPSQRSPLRIAAIAAGGTGLVAFGVGAIFGVDAISKRSDAHCQGTTCPDDASAATLHDAKTAANAATLAFVAGGVLLGGGVALWLVAPGAKSAEARLYVAPAIGGVLLGGRWE